MRQSYKLEVSARLISLLISVLSMRLWVPLNQMGDWPLRWITAIKYQEIGCIQFMEMLKRHLPLSSIGFGIGLGTCFARQIGLLGEMGKKCIQFSLNAGLEARNHGNRHDGQDQNALAN